LEPTKPKVLVTTRIKAFVTDMFMIMMPIMYITTYIILSGKDEFQTSQLSRWLTALVFGAIVVIFLKLKGQTPGLKAYDIKVVNTKTQKNPTYIQATNRYLVFIICAALIAPLFYIFFNKNNLTIWDILSNTVVIKYPN